MVGLGTQDSASEARAFFENFGPFSFPLLWDSTGQSWAEMGITVQPAVAMYRADGTLLKQWYGQIDLAESYLAELTP